ncbi:MAG: PD40 domain-containing protein [Planctomycetes bacterium]|nr:PD40 domain-containing protein [Planctomycetota bacterium]
MRRVLAPLAVAVVAAAAAGPARADEAVWLRDPRIAPDGTRIAFTWRGDVWTVPVAGGRATPVTAHPAVDRAPCWSPDSKWIAFASDRDGRRADVYLVAADGGAERRLTRHEGAEVPTAFTPDGSAVLFVGRRQDDPRSSQGGWWPQLWSVPVGGGRPTLVLATPAVNAHPSPDGTRIVYEDLKAWEDPLRKHHVSSASRDVWSFDPATDRHVALTRSHRGEDRDPSIGPDGRLWWISERGGSANVYVAAATPDAPAERVTDHTVHPVRSLSLARDGTLAYAWDGAIWTKAPGAPSRRLVVEAAPAARENDESFRTYTDEASELAPSPDGKELAFVVRGEVFVASVEHGTTKRVTDTPTMERSVAWSPDGKTLYYAGERDGSWNLYASTVASADEKRFSRATVLSERAVLSTAAEEFQPVPSPDGTALAYVRDRDAVDVLDLASGKTRTVLPASRNASYADGDLDVAWSPDGRWLACTALEEGRYIDGVVVVRVADGVVVDVSRSGYGESDPAFSSDGRMLTFRSDRFGRRNHGSWGSDEDVVGVLLTRAARDRFRLTPEEHDDLLDDEEAAAEDAEGDDGAAPGGEPAAPKDGHGKDAPGGDGKDGGHGGKKGKGDGKGAGKAQDADDEPAPEVEVETELLDERTVRLTPSSAPLAGHAVSVDGETVFTLARQGETWGLFAHRPRSDWSGRVASLGAEEPQRLVLSEDGDTAFVLEGDGSVRRFDVSGLVGRTPPDDASVEGKPVAFSAEVRVRASAERAGMFEHVVRQLERKFYDPRLHGTDWPALVARYRELLRGVGDADAFAELLSELLGELNASHTGARRRKEEEEGDNRTASLGLLFDVRAKGSGLRVAEVLAGGPADRAGARLVPGVTVTHVDGQALGTDVPVEALLERKVNVPVRVRAVPAGGGEAFEEVVKAVSLDAERELLYRRWVRGREALVLARSQGRLGYVHVRSMDDEGFRRVFSDALGKHGAREGLVVDTRFNGGGWLHDDLVAFLSGKDYVRFAPRGKTPGELGAEPARRWSRPWALVVNEADYSDAHVFPFAVQALHLAPVVGAPVAGTGTAVWWETLLDPELVFGIPQVGLQALDGKFLENTELVPDVVVLADPGAVAQGEDPQLEAAVKVVLDAADRAKK